MLQFTRIRAYTQVMDLRAVSASSVEDNAVGAGRAARVRGASTENRVLRCARGVSGRLIERGRAHLKPTAARAEQLELFVVEKLVRVAV